MSNHTYEFARDFLRQVGYVGSKTTHLTGCLDFSQALVATPRHPVTGQTTTTVGNLAQRVPFVGIAGGSYICTTKFDANYNSLQTGVTKRFSHGLDFQASYTFSKNLDFLSNDQTNPRQARGLDDFDRPHRLVLSFLYEPPRLAMGSTLVRHVLFQWQFSGIAVLQAGLSITVTDDRAGSVYGNLPGFVRAECTGANPASSGSIFSRLNGYFNPAAFTTPPVIGSDRVATGFGNCSVGILRGPNQLNLDLGIQRNFFSDRSQRSRIPGGVLQFHRYAQVWPTRDGFRSRVRVWRDFIDGVGSADYSVRSQMQPLNEGLRGNWHISCRHKTFLTMTHNRET